jgi:hypothetical protein
MPGYRDVLQIYYNGKSELEMAARAVATRAHISAPAARREEVDARLIKAFQLRFPDAEPLTFEPVDDSPTVTSGTPGQPILVPLPPRAVAVPLPVPPTTSPR